LLQTLINDPAKAQVLVTAINDVDGTINWAIRGAGLTCIGEIPFSHAGPNDRCLAAIDPINVSNPPRRRAEPTRNRRTTTSAKIGAAAQVRQDAACHFPITAGTGVFMAARVS